MTTCSSASGHTPGTHTDLWIDISIILDPVINQINPRDAAAPHREEPAQTSHLSAGFSSTDLWFCFLSWSSSLTWTVVASKNAAEDD